MNRHQSKLNQNQQEQAHQHQQSASETQVIEFAGAEEALRYDVAQTEVPPSVANRLQESIRHEPPPPGSSWWRKLLGR